MISGPHATARAIASVIQDIKENGIPGVHNRQAMREARELITASQTPHGPWLQNLKVLHENGRPVKLEAVHPLAYLWHCFQTCDGWYALLQ